MLRGGGTVVLSVGVYIHCTVWKVKQAWLMVAERRVVVRRVKSESFMLDVLFACLVSPHVK